MSSYAPESAPVKLASRGTLPVELPIFQQVQMAGMDKICSLHDAIARDVENGMSVAMGYGLESLIPFAASHEIIRQRKTDLTL